MSTEKQRNYKDTVYRMIFKKPENALSLYNSLNGTNYTDTSMLEFNTLENAIYMSIYEYDEERELRLIRADERELGEKIGEVRGKEIGMKIGREEEKENTIKAIVTLYQKFKGKKEDAVEEVIEKCNLSKEAAQEKVNIYWDQRFKES